MESHFTSNFFIANRNKLQTLFAGTAPIVITANGLLQRTGDTTYLFRQDSNFWYLTGIDDPDLILVMDKGKEYLILPERNERQLVFDGSTELQVLKERSGIDTILDNKAGWRQLAGRLKRAKYAATLAVLPPFIVDQGFYANPARAMLSKLIKEANPKIELLDLRQHLTRMRMIKQPEELAAMQSAINITIKAFKQSRRKLNKLTAEYELEAVITQEFRKHGVQHAYQPIVASGKNACTLHYIKNQGQIGNKDIVVIDVGAEVEHYAADITRSYIPSSPSKRQQTVYQTVLDVQEYAKSLLKPGVILKDYEQNVEHFMGEALRKLGLIRSINHDSVRRFYPHATSHFLGLDVHDVADYELPLSPGMVLTIEPGIYIPKEGIGIRVEDDALVTKKGIKVLSRQLPRQL